MSKLDKLFKGKLADHVVAPPSGAWQKVETGLSKKNDTIVWLRWAAVFLMGGLLFTAFWLNEKGTPERVANESTPTQPNHEKEIQKAVRPALTEEKTETRKVKNTPGARKEMAKSGNPQVVIEQAVKEKVTQQTAEPVLQEVIAEPVAKEVLKPIVLVYTLGPVDSTPRQTVSTVSDKKESSIKKVMGFAITMKNSDPLSELRVMKEDLFALDLRKKTTSKKQ